MPIEQTTREKIHQQLLNKSKKQGTVTYDDILSFMPEAERDIGLLDEVMEVLIDEGVNVVAKPPHVYVVDDIPEILRALKLNPSQMISLTPEKFELLICDRLIAMGYDAQRVTDNTNVKDGGIDIIAYVPMLPFGGMIAVQVKHHQTELRKTGAKVVRELAGVISGQPTFQSGLVVTNTAFTKEAIWASKNHINKNMSLRDFQDLARWIKSDFTGEHMFRELPETIEIGNNIVIPRTRFKRI